MAPTPVYDIDPKLFWNNPYPILADMRAETPIAHVPALRAKLILRRDDIFELEKQIDLFSSDQPDGLLVQVMGGNMMRQDGAPHLAQRKALFPAVSPRTVRDHWQDQFARIVETHLQHLAPRGTCELVRDFALPVAADALRAMLGLTNMPTLEVDACSQAMLDEAANYTRDPDIRQRGYAASARVDGYIDVALPRLRAAPDLSIMSALEQGGVAEDQIRGNVKVIIGGGQNEPRDAIAGTVYAVLTNPAQHDMIKTGRATWRDAFDEYVRWVSPIGMTPRRVTRDATVRGCDLIKGETVFFMFGSGNRDAQVFEKPDVFDITRDTSAAIAFGAGPHFCAGAAASKSLIADYALPLLFEHLGDLTLNGDVPFGGWAFRGPLKLPVTWQC